MDALTGRSAAFLAERRYAHPPLPTPSNPQSPPRVPQGAVASGGPRLKSPLGPLSPPASCPPPWPRPLENQPDVSGERLVQTLRLISVRVRNVGLSHAHTHTRTLALGMPAEIQALEYTTTNLPHSANVNSKKPSVVFMTERRRGGKKNEKQSKANSVM